MPPRPGFPRGPRIPRQHSQCQGPAGSPQLPRLPIPWDWAKAVRAPRSSALLIGPCTSVHAAGQRLLLWQSHPQALPEDAQPTEEASDWVSWPLGLSGCSWAHEDGEAFAWGQCAKICGSSLHRPGTESTTHAGSGTTRTTRPPDPSLQGQGSWPYLMILQKFNLPEKPNASQSTRLVIRLSVSSECTDSLKPVLSTGRLNVSQNGKQMVQLQLLTHVFRSTTIWWLSNPLLESRTGTNAYAHKSFVQEWADLPY